MADSDFWRQLAAEFRLLMPDSGMLRADGWYIVGSDAPWDWWLDGDPSDFVSAAFGTLARRGASELPTVGATNLLIVWLEALRQDGSGFRETGSGSELPVGGGERLDRLTGSIPRLCETSATYCKKLESAALQSEFEERQRSEREHQVSPPTPAVPAEIKAETIAAQIRRLREECHLTAEELAEEVELDSRTVQRHLAGETTPYARHVRIYEMVFSKLLSRQIVICKMP
jgi:ribosome-binding protein aMBF1 (putative translation factor)